MTDDSALDTEEHRQVVERLLRLTISNLIERALTHDNSKLVSPEKEMYDEFVPKLRKLAYGSDELAQCREQMGDGLQHHYENNRHHPEHYPNGVDGMNLIDLVEMLADWKAATIRGDIEGDILKSIAINTERYGISDQLVQILKNTVEEMGW